MQASGKPNAGVDPADAVPAASLRLPLVMAMACGSMTFAVNASEVDYQKQIRPILEDRCCDCHGEEKAKAKLRLDSVIGILRGGESGEPLLVRGDSAKSHLIKRVTAENSKEVMPPKGDRLTDGQLELLRAEETKMSETLEAFRRKAVMPNGLRVPVNAKLNEETFPATEVMALKFTVLATN